MPAPSPLAIATSVLNRLVKEEVSYHKELEQQNAKIAKLEAGEGADDQNADFILRQQVCLLPIQNQLFENLVD
jgi:tubulin-specific chaperone A